MFGDSKPKDVGFVAFIDEAGDPGTRSVQPLDPKGASEWFIVSAVVVRAERETEAVDWVRSVRTELRLTQGPSLHYKNLPASKRLAVCQRLANYDCRVFVVASHKPNMRGHTNERAAKKGSQNFFYNWCTRILLERVTSYCRERAIAETGKPRLVQLDFSRAGGLNYDQLRAYHELMRRQTTPFLAAGQLAWDTLHPDLYHAVQPNESAGVQIADIAASAFYQAVHTRGANWDPQFAKALGPRLARSRRLIANHGLTLMPFAKRDRLLDPRQREIFEYFNFDFSP